MSQTQEPKAPKASKTDHPIPYLAARREWDERYGAHLSQARNWRMAALVAFAVAAASVAGVVYMGSRSSIQPFVVAIDDLGSSVAVGWPAADEQHRVTERVKRAQLARWIINVRTVVPDAGAQHAKLQKAYAFASAGVANSLNQHFAANSPFGRRDQVGVQIRGVIPQGGDIWNVTWTETVSLPGQAPTTQSWRAILTIGIDPVLTQTDQGRIFNPLGLFIQDLRWEREAG